eukprot:Sspe_Gene.85262::Locus_56047_Transcript_1_2_Confidence_0.900_Length_426::g.85262::m.85262
MASRRRAKGYKERYTELDGDCSTAGAVAPRAVKLPLLTPMKPDPSEGEDEHIEELCRKLDDEYRTSRRVPATETVVYSPHGSTFSETVGKQHVALLYTSDIAKPPSHHIYVPRKYDGGFEHVPPLRPQ